MGNQIRTYDKFAHVNTDMISNGTFSQSVGEASQIVNNTLLAYAHSRRIQHSSVWNMPINSAVSTTERVVLSMENSTRRALIRINGRNIITRSSRTLTAWVYISTDAATNLDMYLTCGKNESMTSGCESVAGHWVNLSVECPPLASVNLADDLMVSILFRPTGGNLVATITSISIHEYGYIPNRSYVDTDGATNKLGNDDYPWSAATAYMLAGNAEAAYHTRCPRTNILNQTFVDGYIPFTHSAYEANYDYLGRFMIRKGQGVTVLNTLFHHTTPGAAGDQFSITGRLYTTAGVYVDGFEDTFIPAGATDEWRSNTISGLSSAETEYELRLDGKNNDALASDYMTIWNLFVAEGLDGSEIAHTLPNKKRVEMNDDLESRDIKNVKNTIEQIYNRNRQILLNNYYTREGAAPASGYDHVTTNNGQELSVHAYGPIYPSYGSRWLICEVVIELPLISDKRVITCDAHANHLHTDEIITFGTSNARGVVVYDDDPTLYVSNFQGDPIDGETITGATSGHTCTVDGIASSPDLTVQLVFATGAGTVTAASLTNAIHYDLKDVSKLQRGASIPITFKVPISSDYWNSTSDVTLAGVDMDTPYMFYLTSTIEGETFHPIDYVIVHSVKVYEEVPLVLEDYK